MGLYVILLKFRGLYMTKDIMPLIDHGQFKQDDKWAENVVEVVVTVMVPVEGRVVEVNVTTEHLARIPRGIVRVEMDQAMEHLHTNDGKYIVKHLYRNSQ